MKNLLTIAFLILGTTAFAQDVHFFGSIKAAKTTIDDNDITYDETSNKMSLSPLSTAGISFDANLNNKFQVLSQFIYKNNSSLGLDLLQIRHNFDSTLAVRFGLQRLPSNLHSENIQIQALQPWLQAPREVYGRVPVYSFTGASVEKDFGPHVTAHFYGGDTSDTFITEQAEYKSSAQNLLGGRLNFKLSDFKAFVNAYRGEADLTIKSDIANPSLSGTTIGYTRDFKLEAIQGFTSGFEYRPKDFFFMSEYSLVTSRDPALERVEGMYATVGKEINEKWVPVITFSTDLDVDSHFSPTKTTTYAFNLNYRLDYNNIIKAGVEHVNYKERTVLSPTIDPTSTSSASIYTNGSPGQNFDVYSLVWAFVY
jgi:hypothetical protein